MGTRSQKRTVGASLWIIFKATKTRFGMRKSALQAGHLTSSLPSSNFSKRFASGVIVIWVWQPLHGTSIEPAQRSAPVKLISFLSSGIATPICYPSPDRSGTIPARLRQTHGWSCAQSVHWIGNPMRTFENSYGAFRGTFPFYRRMERFTVAQEARVRSAAPLSAGTCANSTS